MNMQSLSKHFDVYAHFDQGPLLRVNIEFICTFIYLLIEIHLRNETRIYFWNITEYGLRLCPSTI